MKRAPVLVVTDYDDVHADAVIEALNARAWPVFRLNTSTMGTDIEVTYRFRDGRFTGLLRDDHRHVSLQDCGAVWFRKPVAPAANPAVREEARLYAQEQFQLALQYLNGVVDARWVNHPVRNRWADNKLVQLRVASECGLKVPDTVLTNSSREVQAFRGDLEPDDAAVKCLEMTLEASKRLSRQHTTQRLRSFDSVEESEVRLAPVIVQRLIPKAHELRCTVIGRNIYAAMIDSQAHEEGRVDWRAAFKFNPDGIPVDLNRYQAVDLPPQVHEAIIRLLDCFGLRFAAIDMIVTPAGDYVFLELNPNGQWLWIQTQTGLPLVDAMVDELTGLTDASW